MMVRVFALVGLLVLSVAASAQTTPPTPARTATLLATQELLKAACVRQNDPDPSSNLSARIGRIEHARAEGRDGIPDVVLLTPRLTARSDVRMVEVTVQHTGLGVPWFPSDTADLATAQRKAWREAYFEVLIRSDDTSARPIRAEVLPPSPSDIVSLPEANGPLSARTTIRFFWPPSNAPETDWRHWFGRKWSIQVLPCVRDHDGSMLAAGYGELPPFRVNSLAAGWAAFVVVVLLVLLISGYGVVRVNAWQFRSTEGKPPPFSLLEALNPFVICQDSLGYASLARFQIFLFTVVLLALFGYTFVMTGYPPGISTSVLTLLGITTTGAAAGTLLSKPSVTQPTHRLWLIGTGVLEMERRAPRFEDLFTMDGAVGITQLQALGFTCFAAIALVVNGHSDLANYELPSQLNALMGISQATYVAGKAITPEALTRLNGELGALIDAEAAAIADMTKTADFDGKKVGIHVALVDVYGDLINQDRLAKLKPGDRLQL